MPRAPRSLRHQLEPQRLEPQEDIGIQQRALSRRIRTRAPTCISIALRSLERGICSLHSLIESLACPSDKRKLGSRF
jgi:hypothetical protein